MSRSHVTHSAGGRRAVGACAVAGIAFAVLLSRPVAAPAADGQRAGDPVRDDLLVNVSDLPAAPAAVTLTIDGEDAQVRERRLVSGTEAGVALASGPNGLSLRAATAQGSAAAWVELKVRRPGRPITGNLATPSGTTVVVALPDGSQKELEAGQFSIPTSATGLGRPPRADLDVLPQRESAGDRVTVTGNVGAKCAVEDRVSLRSEAFKANPDGAVGQQGSFSIRARIARKSEPGRYRIRARCDGENLGAADRVRVLRRGQGPGDAPVDHCAPGQFDYSVCTRSTTTCAART